MRDRVLQTAVQALSMSGSQLRLRRAKQAGLGSHGALAVCVIRYCQRWRPLCYSARCQNSGSAVPQTGLDDALAGGGLAAQLKPTGDFEQGVQGAGGRAVDKGS